MNPTENHNQLQQRQSCNNFSHHPSDQFQNAQPHPQDQAYGIPHDDKRRQVSDSRSYQDRQNLGISANNYMHQYAIPSRSSSDHITYKPPPQNPYSYSSSIQDSSNIAHNFQMPHHQNSLTLSSPDEIPLIHGIEEEDSFPVVVSAENSNSRKENNKEITEIAQHSSEVSTIPRFTDNDIKILKNILQSAEKHKWKFVANSLQGDGPNDEKKGSPTACMKKTFEIFPFLRENFQGNLGTSLPYLVKDNGWKVVSNPSIIFKKKEIEDKKMNRSISSSALMSQDQIHPSDNRISRSYMYPSKSGFDSTYQGNVQKLDYYNSSQLGPTKVSFPSYNSQSIPYTMSHVQRLPPATFTEDFKHSSDSASLTVSNHFSNRKDDNFKPNVMRSLPSNFRPFPSQFSSQHKSHEQDHGQFEHSNNGSAVFKPPSSLHPNYYKQNDSPAFNNDMRGFILSEHSNPANQNINNHNRPSFLPPNIYSSYQQPFQNPQMTVNMHDRYRSHPNRPMSIGPPNGVSSTQTDATNSFSPKFSDNEGKNSKFPNTSSSRINKNYQGFHRNNSGSISYGSNYAIKNNNNLVNRDSNDLSHSHNYNRPYYDSVDHNKPAHNSNPYPSNPNDSGRYIE